MRKVFRKSRAQLLTMRFAGGAGGADDAGTDPAGSTPAQTDPSKVDPAKADPAVKTYTETDIELARQQAVSDYKERQAQQKDYDQMTAEEKVAYLEDQRQSDQLEQHATRLLADNKLSVELMPIVKGKDEADTASRIKLVTELVAKEVQTGVAARFKDNAYQPRGTAQGGDDAPKAKERGVKVQ